MSAAIFLAPALVVLRDEANDHFPRRDKATDGWLGDPSHQARKSDHNPCWTCPGRSEAIVRALDVDISPDGDPDEDLRTQLLRVTIGDPRVWYVISNGKIYSRTYGWEPRVYIGPNPHTAHVHVSLNGANGVPGDPGNFDTSPWWADASPGEGPTTLPAVSLSAVVHASRTPRKQTHPAQVRRVQRALTRKGLAPGQIDGVYGPRTRGAYGAWERKMGRTGSEVNGLPDDRSLTRLGANRFRVVR